jgi:hypothetical protein
LTISIQVGIEEASVLDKTVVDPCQKPGIERSDSACASRIKELGSSAKRRQLHLIAAVDAGVAGYIRHASPFAVASVF